MVLLSQAFISFFLDQTVTSIGNESSSLFRQLSGVFFLILLYLSLNHFQAMMRIIRASWPLCVYVALAVLSSLWSESPMLTARRSTALAATVLFGLYLAARFSPQQILKLTVIALGIGALASFAVVLLTPSIGLSELHAGAWKGVFTHKNQFGRNMLVGYGASLCLLLLDDKSTIRWLAASALFAMAIIFSRSATAYVTAVILTGQIILLWVLRSPMSSWLRVTLLGGVVLTGVGFLAATYPVILEMLGKDVTLTGRLPLWSAMLEVQQQQAPWFGYGYGVFWETEAALHVQALVRWYAGHAHNGVIDKVMHLGVLGACFYVAMLGMMVFQAVKLASQNTNHAWLLIMVTTLLLLSLTSTEILTHNQLYGALFAYTFAMIATKHRSLSHMSYSSTGTASQRSTYSTKHGAEI